MILDISICILWHFGYIGLYWDIYDYMRGQQIFENNLNEQTNVHKTCMQRFCSSRHYMSTCISGMLSHPTGQIGRLFADDIFIYIFVN